MNQDEIKRLIEEKTVFDKESCDVGRNEGERFAKNSSYEVLHAVFVLNKIPDDWADWLDLARVEYDNINYSAFEKGFFEGAKKIWDKLKSD